MAELITIIAMLLIGIAIAAALLYMYKDEESKASCVIGVVLTTVITSGICYGIAQNMTFMK